MSSNRSVTQGAEEFLLNNGSFAANVESDPLMDGLRYWIQGVDGDWFRIKLEQENPKERGEITTINIEALQCRLRTLSEKIFHRRNDDLVFMPFEKRKIALKEIRKRQPAELARINNVEESEIDLLQRKFANENLDAIKMRNGLWIVFNANTNAGLEQMPFVSNKGKLENSEQNEVSSMGLKIVDAIKKHGEIVGDIHAHHAKRICVAIKQFHGDKDAISIIHAGTYKKWMQHQVVLFRIQQEISQIIQQPNLHFFVEGQSPQKWPEQWRQILNADWMREALLPITSTPEGTYLPPVFNNLQRSIEMGDIKGASLTLKIMNGMLAFIYSQIANGNIGLANHVHGLEIPEQETYEADTLKNMPTESVDTMLRYQQAKIVEWFGRSHPHIIANVDQHLKTKDVGILIYGGMHFKSGSDGSMPDNQYLEDYIARTPSLNDMRFIIIKPHFY